MNQRTWQTTLESRWLPETIAAQREYRETRSQEARQWLRQSVGKAIEQEIREFFMETSSLSVDLGNQEDSTILAMRIVENVPGILQA